MRVGSETIVLKVIVDVQVGSCMLHASLTLNKMDSDGYPNVFIYRLYLFRSIIARPLRGNVRHRAHKFLIFDLRKGGLWMFV